MAVSKKPIEKRLLSLIDRNGLLRVDFTITSTGISASAIPAARHPRIEANREALFEAAASRSARGSISIQEAQEISERAAQMPIAHAYGDTFEAVVTALARELKALK